MKYLGQIQAGKDHVNKDYVDDSLDLKQDKLTSGTNIKTINSTSILGSGYIPALNGVFDGSAHRVNLSQKGVVGSETMEFYKTNDGLTMSAHNNVGTVYHAELVDKTYVSQYQTQAQVEALLPTATSQLTNDGDGTNAFVTSGDVATDSDYGVVKTNSAQSISLNANGQLEVGGRMGQFPGTTGIYAPNNREPRNVADYCLLVTDVKGINMSNSRSFADVSGLGITCKRASAGATEYHVNNTYSNRLLCKLLENGYAAKDEAASTVETIPVVSVTIDGASYEPDSAPNDTSKDIIITTERTLNPDAATTTIRAVGLMAAYSTAHIGNGIASLGGGRNLLLGGGITKAGSGNDNCVVGNGQYVNTNGNAVFGRFHIAKRNRGFLAGQGHDTTNANGEGVSAIGNYSYLDANSMFAVGNGSSHTDRLNLFEVLKDGSIVLRSPNGTRYKIAVADDGTLSTTAIT